MSKNNGLRFESYCSKTMNLDKTPILVSPLLLRDYGCGQVDLLFLDENFLYLYEVKETPLISKKQTYRLKKTSQLLEYIFQKTIFRKMLYKIV